MNIQPASSGYAPLRVLEFGHIQSEVILHSGLSLLPVSRDMDETSVLSDEPSNETEVFGGEKNVPKHHLFCFRLARPPSLRFAEVRFDGGIDTQKPVRKRSSLGHKLNYERFEGLYSDHRLVKVAVINLAQQAAISNGGPGKRYLEAFSLNPKSVLFGSPSLIEGRKHNECASTQREHATKKRLIVFYPTEHDKVRPPADQAVQPKDLSFCANAPFDNERNQHERRKHSGVAEPVFPRPHRFAPSVGKQSNVVDSVKETAA